MNKFINLFLIISYIGSIIIAMARNKKKTISMQDTTTSLQTAMPTLFEKKINNQLDRNWTHTELATDI